MYIGSGLIAIDKTWTDFKAMALSKGYTSFMQFDESADQYNIFFIDSTIVYTCRIYKGIVPGPGQDQTQNDADKDDFEDNYKGSSNKPLISKTSSGKPVVSTFPTEGTRTTIVTHNWCDKTTWYQKSTRVVDEVASAVVLGTSYQVDHEFLIDIYHGKLWAEDTLKDSSNNSYRVVVKVNDVQKTENDPHTGVGDYTIDYDTGIITFSPTINVLHEVKVTYHYAGSSEFVVSPSSGKSLKIRSVETQFSTDVAMNDTVEFVGYGYVDVFAPQYLQSNGGPYPSGTKIPIATTRYKTMYDFQAESNGALPTLPAIGGVSWRGIHNSIVVFPWEYTAVMTLSHSAGMEIRMKLAHDSVFSGEFATATLYCLSESE